MIDQKIRAMSQVSFFDSEGLVGEKSNCEEVESMGGKQ